jgi:hypothetical protein
MSAQGGTPPFLAAWLEAQQAFASLAGAGVAFDPAATRTRQLLADQYRLLFAMPAPSPAVAGPAAAGEAWLRYQQAAERFGRLVSGAAADAARRLGETLARTGPDAPPITTWRELLALWIECGEEAWSAAAHRDEFAAAQAELLAALAGLRAAGPSS